MFDNLDDPRTQGLLYMAAAMMQGQQGKPNVVADLSRGLLGGLQGYNQGKSIQAQMADEALKQKLLGFQVKSAEQNFNDEQTARDVFARRLQPPQQQSGLLSPNNTGNLDTAGTPSLYGGQPQPFPPQLPQMPPQMPPQGMQPTTVPFGKGAAVTSAPAAAGQGKFDTFNKYNSIADDLENAGAITQAQKYRDMAEKFRPKLKDEQVRLVNGAPQVVRNYEDGTTEISPYAPTANIDYLDVKNAKLPIDKNTGKTAGAPIPMGIDPAEAQRLAMDRARLGNENTRLFYETGMGGGGGSGGAAPSGGTNLPPAVRAKIAQSQAEGLNTGGVTYKNALDATVQTGNDLMTRIAESRRALDQFKPGMGASARLDAARAAQAINAPDWMVNALNAGDVSAKQEFQKLAAQQAMETLKSAMGGSGRITQAEFKVFQENNPNIELDPNAIKKIYDFAEKTHRRNVAEQASLRTYLKDGGDISQWPAEWTKRTGGGQPPVSGFRYLGKE